MKSNSLFIFAVLAATTLAVSGSDETTPINDRPGVTSSPVLLNRIPDGSPLPESEPLPRYEVKPSDVLASRSVQQDGRTITFQEIRPIALPPVPEASHAPPAPRDPGLLAQRLAEHKAMHPATQILHLGARVYRYGENPPRSLVTCWPTGGNPPFTFWSSADFSLIAGGIQSFTDSSGQTHHLFMSWGNFDEACEQASALRRGSSYQPPTPPEFQPGSAAFQIVGDQPEAGFVLAIQSLHELYHQNQAELLAAYHGREQARLQKEEALRLNPPQPKDLTLNYWRSEKPAKPVTAGGAR